MKPQCETTADCLEQLARVMREFGFTSIADAFSSGYVLRRNEINTDYYDLSFEVPEEWSFAIAKLEANPVFLGDTVYELDGNDLAVQSRDGEDICFIKHDKNTYISAYYQLSELDSALSWTPPKQTVTVQIGNNEPVEVEKALAIRKHTESAWVVVECGTYEAAEQFRKAMKPLVKE